MATVKREVGIYHCPSCGEIEPDRETTCCGEEMEEIKTTAVFEPPEVEEVAKQVFGAPAMELEICDVLMAQGEASVSTLTEQFAYDRSTIYRHLDHLVERGMVTKRSEQLTEGGRVHVYSCVPPDEMRRKLTASLYLWEQKVIEKMDDRMQTKIEVAEATEGATTSGSNSGTTTDATRATDASEAESNAVEQGDSLIGRLVERDWLS